MLIWTSNSAPGGIATNHNAIMTWLSRIDPKMAATAKIVEYSENDALRTRTYFQVTVVNRTEQGPFNTDDE